MIRLRSRSNISRTRSRLIRTMVFLCLVLAVINLVFIVISSRVSYVQYNEEYTALLSQQLGSIYDLYFRQIIELINKTATFDFPAYDIRDIESNPYDFYRGVLAELDAMAAANTNIHSACLAIPEKDLVIDSRTIGKHIHEYDSYYDREILRKAQASAVFVSEPHAAYMTNGAEGTTVVSVVCHTNLKHGSTYAMLNVNVSISQLLNEAKKIANLEDNIELAFVSSEKNLILGSSELSALAGDAAAGTAYSIIRPNRQSTVSTYRLPTLNWDLILSTQLSPLFRMKQWLFVLDLGLILLALTCAFFLLLHRTAPIDNLEAIADQARWQKCLLNELPIEEQPTLPLPEYGRMTTVLIQGVPERQTDRERKETERKLHYHAVAMNPQTTAVIVWREDTPEENDFREEVIRLVNELYDLSGEEKIYIGAVQSIRSLLPLAWQQCKEMERCSISLQDRYCVYDATLCEKMRDIVLPDHYHEKVHNFILSGNTEQLLSICREIFIPLRKSETYIENEHLLNHLTMLLNATVNDMLSIPVSIDEALPEFTVDMQLDDIESSFTGFMEIIAGKASSTVQRMDDGLYQKIAAYVQTNYASSSLSLQQMCDELNIQPAAGSRVIRDYENLSFPEFVNKHRIETAKVLLSTTAKTIEEISHDVGYNYAYYFIKVFKGMEGVTPGQYRTSHTRLPDGRT